MPKCATCGNNYDKAFIVVHGETSYFFDSFECAIAKLAPKCATCGIHIVGHGIESNGACYCCAHCERNSDAHSNSEPAIDTAPITG